MASFDSINHQALLDKTDTFPTLRRALKGWLEAGVLDAGQLFPMQAGTPQGGVISPLLANIALHGLEEALVAAFPKTKEVKRKATKLEADPDPLRRRSGRAAPG